MRRLVDDRAASSNRESVYRGQNRSVSTSDRGRQLIEHGDGICRGRPWCHLIRKRRRRGRRRYRGVCPDWGSPRSVGARCSGRGQRRSRCGRRSWWYIAHIWPFEKKETLDLFHTEEVSVPNPASLRGIAQSGLPHWFALTLVKAPTDDGIQPNTGYTPQKHTLFAIRMYWYVPSSRVRF